jgi:hypothetical protein
MLIFENPQLIWRVLDWQWDQGPYSYHFIFCNLNGLNTAVFVPSRPFQPSLFFASKGKAYPSEAPYPQTLDKGGKACQEQMFKHIGPVCKLQKNKLFEYGFYAVITTMVR